MPSAYVNKLSDELGIPVSRIEKLWDKAKEIVKKEYGKSENDDNFYALVTGILKRMLKIKEYNDCPFLNRIDENISYCVYTKSDCRYLIKEENIIDGFQSCNIYIAHTNRDLDEKRKDIRRAIRNLRKRLPQLKEKEIDVDSDKNFYIVKLNEEPLFYIDKNKSIFEAVKEFKEYIIKNYKPIKVFIPEIIVSENLDIYNPDIYVESVPSAKEIDKGSAIVLTTSNSKYYIYLESNDLVELFLKNELEPDKYYIRQVKNDMERDYSQIQKIYELKLEDNKMFIKYLNKKGRVAESCYKIPFPITKTYDLKIVTTELDKLGVPYRVEELLDKRFEYNDKD